MEGGDPVRFLEVKDAWDRVSEINTQMNIFGDRDVNRQAKDTTDEFRKEYEMN